MSKEHYDTYIILESDVLDVCLLEAVIGRLKLDTGKATKTHIVSNDVPIPCFGCQLTAVTFAAVYTQK